VAQPHLHSERLADPPHRVRSDPANTTMTTVGIFEARNRLSEPVEQAARGDDIVVT
jgi:hypothetical protein